MKHSPVILLILAIFLPAAVLAGSLTVGTKVIYPGGADQPPKEKDTGVSFKAEVTGMARSSSGKCQPDQIMQMLEQGDYSQVLAVTENRHDSQSLAMKAIALFHSDEEKAAIDLAEKLMKDKNLSRELKEKLCNELDLEMPDFEKETSDNEEGNN
ncbi:MAG: hypothetical protein ACOYXC_07420 [Candidatus Rifleibacteriota bacterium]